VVFLPVVTRLDFVFQIIIKSQRRDVSKICRNVDRGFLCQSAAKFFGRKTRSINLKREENGGVEKIHFFIGFEMCTYASKFIQFLKKNLTKNYESARHFVFMFSNLSP
jgi:hypothetical protein